MRRGIWGWFDKTVHSLGNIHAVIVNGDAIDGRGEKSGGTELLAADRNEQVEMAAAAIMHIPCKTRMLAYGTPYHAGQLEDWEDAVAAQVHAEKIGGEDTVDVDGVLINYRHHIGRSGIPHGRHTAVAKEALWNALWNERGEYPRAHIILRSHVHYVSYAGGADWVGITTPALQGYGGKYGTRIMSGTVDIGMIVIDVIGKGEFVWKPLIFRLPMHKPISL